MSEKFPDTAFQAFTAEIVDRPEIRPLTATEPHEGDIFCELLSDFTAGVNVVQIAVNQDFQQYLRMIGTCTPPLYSFRISLISSCQQPH